MRARQVAERHYGQRRALARAVSTEGRRLWRTLHPQNLSGWTEHLGRLLTVLVAAQRAAAGQAEHYAVEVLAAQGIDDAPSGRVAPSAFAGVASDGRPLQSLLWSPVVAAKRAIGRGVPPARAMATGEVTLELITRTQVADAGRVADGVAIAARPRVGYVRMLVGDSCPRCAILAGRFYRWLDGFERHPLCDCTHIPASEDTAGDLSTDPRRAFEAGRITGLSAADAQAIRDGADLGQVVNAHRGMYTAGGRKLTREGTSRRGFAGSRLPGAGRPMPEQIYREASSRDEAIRLLRRHGFIV
jgi:hypothetical protein